MGRKSIPRSRETGHQAVRAPASLHEDRILQGNRYLAQEKWSLAAEIFRKELNNPHMQGPVHNGLGIALFRLGRSDEALRHFEIASRLGTNPQWIYNQAHALAELRRFAEAKPLYERVIQMKPDHFGAHAELANAMLALQEYEAAAPVLCKAHDLMPAGDPYAEQIKGMFYALATKLDLDGKEILAAECFRRALLLDPENPVKLADFARILRRLGQLEDSQKFARMACDKDPENLIYKIILASAMAASNQIEESTQILEQVMSSPQYGALLPRIRANIHRNLMSQCHYSDRYSPEQIFQMHREAARTYEQAMEGPVLQPVIRQPTQGRRLRIGYASFDLRGHAVTHFLEPILQSHDRERFEIYCYALSGKFDAVSQRLKDMSTVWRQPYDKSPLEMARIIHEDQVDILVDLMGYTNDALGLFTYKPAPVQVTYLGYPDTTALPTMDYRLTDAKADPPGMTEHLHTEKLVRLPESNWCIRFGIEPTIGPIPSLARGYLVFGSFNSICKTTATIIKLWARILEQVPESMLVLKSMDMHQEGTRQRLERMLAEHGIPEDRHLLLPPAGQYEQHLSCYNQVDIALDTFPYHGTTTTCEAMFMGVPVVSLAGRAHVSRVGASLLETVGLGDLVAESPETYVSKAVALANDRERLVHWRQTLRESMKKSILMDGPRFTRQLEAAYLEMWEEKVAAPA